MLRLPRSRGLARLASATVAVLALAAPVAQATVTQTNITSPANHAVIVNDGVSGEPHLTVTGSAPGASDGDMLDVYCTRATLAGGVETSKLNPSPIAIAGQAFSYSGSFKPIQRKTCVLRALPSGPVPADLTPFSGPQLAIDEQASNMLSPGEENYRVVGGPNNGALYDFYFWGAQFHGAIDYLSISSCGVCDSYAVDPTTSAQGGRLFNSNAALFSRDLAHDRSDIQIDGNNSYTGYGAQRLIERSAPATFDGSQDYENFPSISFAATVDPLTGDVSLSEEGSFSHCVPGNPAADAGGHVQPSECTSFAPTGVSYKRQMIQNQDGALVAVLDTFHSTDSAPHTLDLLYFQSVLSPPSHSPGYSFPWISSAFQTPAEDASIAPPPGAASIFIESQAGQADGDEQLAQGAIALSAPPSAINFGHTPNEIELHYLRTVPAGASVSIGQAFVTAFALGDVQALALKAQAALEPPLAIAVPIAAPISTPPAIAPSPPARPTASIAKASYDGKDILLTIACQAGSATCTGSAAVTATLRTKAKAPEHKVKHAIAKVKTRAKLITVASASFSIPAGQTQTLKLKVGKTATGLIAHLGRLAATITVNLSESAHSFTAVSAHLTLVHHKARKRKR